MRAVLPLTGRFVYVCSHVGDSGAFVLCAAGKNIRGFVVGQVR